MLVGALRTHQAGLTDEGLSGGHFDRQPLGGQGTEPAAHSDGGQQDSADRHQERGSHVRRLGGSHLLVIEGVVIGSNVPSDLGRAPNRVDRERRVSTVHDRSVAHAHRIRNDRAEAALLGAFGVREILPVGGKTELPTGGGAGEHILGRRELASSGSDLGGASRSSQRVVCACALGGQAVQVGFRPVFLFQSDVDDVGSRLYLLDLRAGQTGRENDDEGRVLIHRHRLVEGHFLHRCAAVAQHLRESTCPVARRVTRAHGRGVHASLRQQADGHQDEDDENDDQDRGARSARALASGRSNDGDLTCFHA